jgi:hypothetical protein
MPSLKNQPAESLIMNNNQKKSEPEQQKDGWQAIGLMAAFAIAVGGANMAFLHSVDKAQDADPVYVMPVAERSVEELGYGNVHFATFNKEADKPARLTFTAEKDFVVYQGEADCTSRSCSKINLTVSYKTPGA